jgi:hypothetical protein
MVNLQNWVKATRPTRISPATAFQVLTRKSIRGDGIVISVEKRIAQALDGCQSAQRTARDVLQASFPVAVAA